MILRIIEIIIYAIIAIGGNVLMWTFAVDYSISTLFGVIGLMGMALLIKTIRLTDAQLDNVDLKKMLTTEAKGVIEDDVTF